MQIRPGATIGILGAGQLGKMSLVAAHQLGYHTAVYAKDDDIPAMEMATHRIVVPNWNDPAGVDQLVNTCDVITTEWENVPLPLVQELEQRGAVVRPSSRVLEVAQSRSREKMVAGYLSVPMTETVSIPSAAFDADGDWTRYLPGILKTDTQGYDGKGQFPVNSVEELNAARKKAGVDCVLERRVVIAHEFSIIVARTHGQIAFSDMVENTHVDGILRRTVWPIPNRELSRQLNYKAQMYAKMVADFLDLQGILCLEFFVDEGGALLFNEMAPRPHNSFHGSIEAGRTSQFEQHIRAVCNLPLGCVKFHTPFEMKNLIGGSWADWAPALTNPKAKLHLYGKAESRPGRKMGHVTRLLR